MTLAYAIVSLARGWSCISAVNHVGSIGRLRTSFGAQMTALSQRDVNHAAGIKKWFLLPEKWLYIRPTNKGHDDGREAAIIL